MREVYGNEFVQKSLLLIIQMLVIIGMIGFCLGIIILAIATKDFLTLNQIR